MRHVRTLEEGGVSVSVHYSNVYEEYRVKISSKPAADYFTSDRTDALMTAQLMLGEELARLRGPAVGQNGPDCSPAGSAPGSPTAPRPARP